MIDDHLAQAANRLLAAETISAAGAQFARGAWAVASRLPAAMRRTALQAVIEELQGSQPALAVHVLAALRRAETDAEIVARSPWPGEPALDRQSAPRWR